VGQIEAIIVIGSRLENDRRCLGVDEDVELGCGR